MITITNNQEGKEKVLLKVTKGAFESFYKRLGYSIVVEEERKGEKALKATPKSVNKIEDNIENISFEETTIKEKAQTDKKTVNSKRKGISD